MEQKRVVLWDNLKFFLILSVVIGHFAEVYTSNIYDSIFIFIYGFHMPLFIFVSGLFHKNTQIVPKACAYISLYFVCKIAIFLLRRGLGDDVSFSVLKEEGLPWFMFALAAFAVLTYLLRNVNKKFLLFIWILVACFAGYDASVGDYLMLSRIIVFYPFYLLGTIVSRERLEELAEKRWVKIVGLVIIVIWGSMCIFRLDTVYLLRPLFTGRNPFSAVTFEAGWIHRLLAYAISAVVGFSFILIVPKKKLPAISVCGQRTLQVYFWHRIILYILTYLFLHECLCQTREGKILWLLIGVAVTLVTSLKIFSFPTEVILKFRNTK